jgi:hypothetical protein
MKFCMKIAVMSLCLLMAAVFAIAQDHPKPANDTPANIPHLRVDILLTEYAGDKKVNSLPYTLYVGASDFVHNLDAKRAFLRMGVRVPIATGPANSSSTQYQYQNVGTNIDVSAFKMEESTYRLLCNVERTSVSSPSETNAPEVPRDVGTLPVLSNFNSEFEISLHDGGSAEGMSATDPFSGHVMKINVTMHVLK